MIRRMTEADRALFLTLSDEFYHSSGVLHPIPESHFTRTFDEAMASDRYVALYLVAHKGEAAGYGQLSFTWSTEAGGLVVWLEELYIRPAFQGKGLGSEYFAEVEREFGANTARFRLEVEPGNDGAIRLYGRLGYEPFAYLQMVREQSK